MGRIHWEELKLMESDQLYVMMGVEEEQKPEKDLFLEKDGTLAFAVILLGSILSLILFALLVEAGMLWDFV